MACFIAPVTEAVVVSIIKRQQKKKEEELHIENGEAAVDAANHHKTPFSQKLGWLSNMLWGGSYLLAIEHIWHGEIVAYPPFLTAMMNSADIQPMLQEIASVGSAMALLITVIWGVMVAVSNRLEAKRDGNVLVKTEE